MNLLKALLDLYEATNFDDFKKDITDQAWLVKDTFYTNRDGFKILRDVGIKFKEKPDWESLDQDDKPLTAELLGKAEEALGFKFTEFNADEVFAHFEDEEELRQKLKRMPAWERNERLKTVKNKGAFSPLADAEMVDVAPYVFIVKTPDGNRYLVDSTAAHSYIRMWKRIAD